MILSKMHNKKIITASHKLNCTSFSRSLMKLWRGKNASFGLEVYHKRTVIIKQLPDLHESNNFVKVEAASNIFNGNQSDFT